MCLPQNTQSGYKHFQLDGIKWIFLIPQNFPLLDSECVGKDIIPYPEILMRFFMDTKYFKVLYSNYFYDSVSGKGNDNWYTFFLQKI